MTIRYNFLPLDFLRSAAAPWWPISGQTVLAVYQPLGAANLTESYLDLSGNGNHLSVGVAPTFNSSTGWTFNGTTQYLITPIIVPTLNVYSILCRFDNAAVIAYSALIADWTTVNARFGLFPIYAGTNNMYGNGGLRQIAAAAHTSGVMGIAANQGYFNGSTEGSPMSPFSGTSTNALYIGARNIGGVASTFYQGNIQAIVIYTTTLTGQQMSDMTTAINAL